MLEICSVVVKTIEGVTNIGGGGEGIFDGIGYHYLD